MRGLKDKVAEDTTGFKMEISYRAKKSKFASKEGHLRLQGTGEALEAGTEMDQMVGAQPTGTPRHLHPTGQAPCMAGSGQAKSRGIKIHKLKASKSYHLQGQQVCNGRAN